MPAAATPADEPQSIGDRHLWPDRPSSMPINDAHDNMHVTTTSCSDTSINGTKPAVAEDDASLALEALLPPSDDSSDDDGSPADHLVPGTSSEKIRFDSRPIADRITGAAADDVQASSNSQNSSNEIIADRIPGAAAEDEQAPSNNQTTSNSNANVDAGDSRSPDVRSSLAALAGTDAQLAPSPEAVATTDASSDEYTSHVTSRSLTAEDLSSSSLSETEALQLAAMSPEEGHPERCLPVDAESALAQDSAQAEATTLRETDVDVSPPEESEPAVVATAQQRRAAGIGHRLWVWAVQLPDACANFDYGG